MPTSETWPEMERECLPLTFWTNESSLRSDQKICGIFDTDKASSRPVASAIPNFDTLDSLDGLGAGGTFGELFDELPKDITEADYLDSFMDLSNFLAEEAGTTGPSAVAVDMNDEKTTAVDFSGFLSDIIDVQPLQLSDQVVSSSTDTREFLTTDFLEVNGSDLLLEVGGSDLLEVGGSDLLEVGGSDLLEVGGSDLLEVGGSDLLEVNGSDLLEVGGSDLLEMSGSDFVVSGASQLDMADVMITVDLVCDSAPTVVDHDYMSKKEAVTAVIASTSGQSPAPGKAPKQFKEKYRERRDKNNVASRRSRQIRKLKFVEMDDEADQLVVRNEELRAKIIELESLAQLMKAELIKKMTDK